MNKLYLLIGIFVIILAISTYAFTSKENAFGATFLFTNDSFEGFSKWIQANATECYAENHNNTYNTWMNETREYSMLCHIVWSCNNFTSFNGTNLINDICYINWNSVRLTFYRNSPLMNMTWCSIVAANSTSSTLENFDMGVQIAFNNITQMRGICPPRTFELPNTDPNIQTQYNTNITLIGFVMQGLTYNTTTNPDIEYNGLVKNQFFNLNMNHTMFLNSNLAANPIWDNFNNADVLGTSFIYDVYDFTSYLSPKQDVYGASMFLRKPMQSAIFNHLNAGYCFVPFLGQVVGEFKNSEFQCGTYYAFGYLSLTNINVTDSKVDTTFGGGFLASFDLYIYNTFNYKFRDILGFPVVVNWNISQPYGLKTGGISSEVNEKVLNQYYTPSTFSNYMPMNITITNGSYSIIDAKLNWTMTSKEVGQWLIQPYPYRMLFDPASNYQLKLG